MKYPDVMARKNAPRHVRTAVAGKPLVQELLHDGTWAVLSTDVFAIVESSGEAVESRPWHEVAMGEWESERHTMTITWVDGSRPTRIRTADAVPVNFPRIFKERVDASLVYFETVPVAGGLLRGALRRKPNGEVISQISSDTKLPKTPEIEAQITELEQKLWDFLGI